MYKKIKFFLENYFKFLEFEHSLKCYIINYILFFSITAIFYLIPLVIAYDLQINIVTSIAKDCLAIGYVILLLFIILNYCFNLICNKKVLLICWYLMLLIYLAWFSCFALFVEGFHVIWVLWNLVSILFLALFCDIILFIILLVSGYTLGYLLSHVFVLHFIDIVVRNINMEIYIYIFVVIVSLTITYTKRYITLILFKQIEEINLLQNNVEQKVKERTISLEQTIMNKNYVINTLSHEVRIPLQGIIGITTTFKEKVNKLSMQQMIMFINIINSSCSKLFELTSNLLDLAKFSTLNMQLNFQTINLYNLILDTLVELKPMSVYKNIPLEVKISHEINPLVRCDPIKISQVLRNILSNAFKYTNTGNIKVQINKIDSVMQISIKDTGIGIPIEELEIIFEQFKQSTLLHKYAKSSTGLGLTLAKEIITAHNGKIWAEKNPSQQGSVFYFTLPLDNLVQEENSQVLKYSNENEKITIFLVDDEEICLIATELMLQSLNFTTISTKRYEDVFHILDNNKIDLMLLDVIINNCSGVEVLKKIKNHEKYQNIPVIMQSGIVDNSTIKKAMDLGAKGYLVKPYTKADFLNVIMKLPFQFNCLY